MLKTQERVSGGVAYLDVTGRIEGEDVSMLKAAFDDLVQRGAKCIALELGSVDRVDSLGLGTLVLLQQAAARAGVALCLVRLTRHVHNLMIVTRLIQCFEHFETEEEVRCWAVRVGQPAHVGAGPVIRQETHDYSCC